MAHACPFCQKYLDFSDLKTHIKIDHKLQKQQQCNYCHCYSRFKNIYSYMKHLNAKHLDSKIFPNSSV